MCAVSTQQFTPSDRCVFLAPEQDIDTILENGNLGSYDAEYEFSLVLYDVVQKYKGGPYIGAWQNKFERDYLIPVFYEDMDFVKVPMRAFKTLFDIFRMNYYEVNLLFLTEVKEITPDVSKRFVKDLGLWGLSISIKDFLTGHTELQTTTDDIYYLNRAIFHIHHLLTKNIYPRLNITFENV